MGYRGGELVDLAAPLERGIDRFAYRTTERIGRDLHGRVKRHTPVSSAGETSKIIASYGSGSAWIRARGRRPGTLEDSWQVGEVTVISRAGGSRYRVPVFTLDPVAPHVEWPTMPHLILPRNPSGVLTIPTRGGMVFAKVVHHPGTQGSYMMATSLQEVAATWQGVARREWASEARRLWSGGVS